MTDRDPIELARRAFERLLDHIDRVAYRDSAQLRLGPNVQQYERAREALEALAQAGDGRAQDHPEDVIAPLLPLYNMGGTLVHRGQEVGYFHGGSAVAYAVASILNGSIKKPNRDFAERAMELLTPFFNDYSLEHNKAQRLNDAIASALACARREALESARESLSVKNDAILLACGELSRAELRVARIVLDWKLAQLRRLLEAS